MANTKNTTESFIQKSKLKHGDFYDYSKVIYEHSRTPVVIGCPAHGYFSQKPVYHQLGRGCHSCAKETTSKKRTFSKEYFISLANKKHNSQYDYSMVDYKHSQKKIKIRCLTHGVFEQSPNSHLQGAGCYKCNHKKASIDRMLSINVFKDRAVEVHGDTYDYSESNYVGMTKNLKIKCKDHGYFLQIPSVHLQGKGCPKCGVNRMTLSQEDFINRSREKHGSTYDYSLVKYKTSNRKVKIICSIHGVFNQLASSHMNGQGCAKCAREKNGWSRSRHTKAAERNNHSMIYLIECFNDHERFYKVGITTHQINRRFNGKDCMPYAFNVLSTLSTGAYDDWNNEKIIHRNLKSFRYSPMISFKGEGECFYKLTEEVREFFGV